MATCIYNHFLLEQEICTLLGYCTQKSHVMEWTCKECTGALTRLSEYMSMDDTIAKETASVVRMVIWRNVQHWWSPSFLWPCPFLPQHLSNKAWNFARR